MTLSLLSSGPQSGFTLSLMFVYVPWTCIVGSFVNSRNNSARPTNRSPVSTGSNASSASVCVHRSSSGRAVTVHMHASLRGSVKCRLKWLHTSWYVCSVNRLFVCEHWRVQGSCREATQRNVKSKCGLCSCGQYIFTSSVWGTHTHGAQRCRKHENRTSCARENVIGDQSKNEQDIVHDKQVYSWKVSKALFVWEKTSGDVCPYMLIVLPSSVAVFVCRRLFFTFDSTHEGKDAQESSPQAGTGSIGIVRCLFHVRLLGDWLWNVACVTSRVSRRAGHWNNYVSLSMSLSSSAIIIILSIFTRICCVSGPTS